MAKSQNFANAGQIKVQGYPGDAINFTIEKQFLDNSTWTLHVNQFRFHTDIDNGWRGEFWGKMMRGAALTYRASKNAKLYSAMVSAVEDLLSTQEPNGRISSYPIYLEFKGWDMWSRKYVMLGLQYFLEICQSEKLKRKIVKALKRHADYIIKYIGPRKRLSIFDTSQVWGGLNSCSILEPFVKLYNLTQEQKYLDFASYLVSTGFCTQMNLIDLCLKKELYPYQFAFTKAYEMMSCFEGLLEYYKVTGNADHLKAVENFVEMVVETDYTLIGSSGCTHELFDNSSLKQTEPTDQVMQETCVTVTFMKLCAKLFAITGQGQYAELIEKSGYNAMLGAVNDTNQDMHRAEGRKWLDTGLVLVPHEPFPFDSYSPLYQNRRGRVVGGFMQLQNGRSYGCCACIGGAGTAILGLTTVTTEQDAIRINLYHSAKFQNDLATIVIKANPYGKGVAKISVKGNGKFVLKLRVPAWAKDFSIKINGEEYACQPVDGYVEICREWAVDQLLVSYSMPVVAHILNKKVAFTRGAITLARDCRLDDVTLAVETSAKNGKGVRAKVVSNDKFHSQLAVEVATRNGKITLCDYSSAGKNYDDDNSLITVWQDVK